MSIQTELTRLTNAKTAIKTAIEGKGVIVPESTLLDGMAALIESIEAGGGDIEKMTFTPATTGVSEFFSFDKIPFYIVCIRKNFEYGDSHETDIYDIPFCASISLNHALDGNQQLISLYNSSSSYFVGKIKLSNSRINTSTLPSSSYPVCFRWSDTAPCYFAFYASDEGRYGLRVGETYQVIVVFREETA